jgi:hypothetical protein
MLMTKGYCFIFGLLVIWCHLDVSSAALNVTLPTLGTILGKEIKTIGNLNNPQKTYYSFRNIPYAEAPVGDKRFSVTILRFLGS